MISRDLDLMKGTFISRWAALPEEDRQKGIPSSVVKEWISRDIAVVEIIMPLIGWRKLVVAGSSFWFEPNGYNAIIVNIKGYLYDTDFV